MNNVISFPTRTENQYTPVNPTRASFLAICYSELSTEDYIELLEAIACKDFYDEVDVDIQELADMFYEA